MKPTVTSLRPAFCSAAMMFRHALAVGASGFSQNTGVPASMHAMTSASCAGPWVQIITASTSGDSMSSLLVANAFAPIESATAWALSALMSDTATTRPPAMTEWILSMCALPMPPGPIMPMRTVMSFSFEAEGAGGEVLADCDGVGQRVGRVARVHVLLADHVQVLVEIGERLDQVGHVRLAGWWGDRAAPVDRGRERPVFLLGLLDDLRVHGLGVDVGDALGVLLDDVHGVALAVDDVSGVEAEPDVVGVGCLEDAVDVLRRLDVRVAVRV